MQRSPGNRRRWQVKQADCFTALPRLDADSVDAIVTDPPYGIGVNGMAWDRPARLDPSTRAGKRAPPTEREPEPGIPGVLARVEQRLPAQPQARRAPRGIRRPENRAPPRVRPRRSRLRTPRRPHVAPRPGLPRDPCPSGRAGHRPEAGVGANHPRPQAARRDPRSQPQEAQHRRDEHRRHRIALGAQDCPERRPRARPADHRE